MFLDSGLCQGHWWPRPQNLVARLLVAWVTQWLWLLGCRRLGCTALLIVVVQVTRAKNVLQTLHPWLRPENAMLWLYQSQIVDFVYLGLVGIPASHLPPDFQDMFSWSMAMNNFITLIFFLHLVIWMWKSGRSLWWVFHHYSWHILGLLGCKQKGFEWTGAEQ